MNEIIPSDNKKLIEKMFPIVLIGSGICIGYLIAHYFTAYKIKKDNIKLVKKGSIPTDKEVEGLLDKWKSEISNPNKTSDSIANLYNNDAVLHGTLASDLAEGKDAIKEYFDVLLENDNISVEIDNNTVKNNDSTVSNSGVYTFSLDKDGKTRQLNARYSFIYAKDNDGEWKIVNHHSSRRKPTPKKS